MDPFFSFRNRRKSICKINLKVPPLYIRKINKVGNFTKCLKNQLCDVIKMRDMRGEVGKKTLKKRDK